MLSQIDLTRLIKPPVTDEGDYIQLAVVQSDNTLFPAFREVLDEIAGLRKLTPVYMMYNVLKAGKKTPVHRDFLKPTPLQPHKYPLIERWHLPIQTNSLAFFCTEGMCVHAPLGEWFGPVEYWKDHYVTNEGDTDRIHIIVDLDTPEPMGAYS